MSDFSRAVKVPSVEAEYAHVRATACVCGGPFAGRGQRLLIDPASGRRYDEIEAACAKCGASRAFLFDISEFFGRREPAPRSERGCFIVIWTLAAAAAVGGVFAWRAGIAPLALIAFAAALFLAWNGRPARPGEAPPPPPPPLDGGDDEKMIRALERLGIPLDMGTTDPADALVGGAAKAGIFVNVQALEGRRWEDAAKGFSSTLSLLSKRAEPQWNTLKGVVHRLRARAHEGAGRRAEALADYQAALALRPDDPEAREGLARLS